MSSLIFNFLLWIILIHKHQCTIIRLEHNKRMKDGIEFVMQKYLNPLRKLTAELPNHAIEMQIEFQDPGSSLTSSTHVPQRRLIRVINHRQKYYKRASNSSDATTPSTTETEATESTTVSTTPSKMPVYMEDLQKALADLEKKIIASQGSSTSSSSNQISTTVSTVKSRKHGSEASAQQSLNVPLNSPQVRNIDDLVQILRKAIHAERRHPRPNDDNLEWVQLKIPKNM